MCGWWLKVMLPREFWLDQQDISFQVKMYSVCVAHFWEGRVRDAPQLRTAVINVIVGWNMTGCLSSLPLTSWKEGKEGGREERKEGGRQADTMWCPRWSHIWGNV